MGLRDKLASLKDRLDGRDASKPPKTVESSSTPVLATGATTSERRPEPDDVSHPAASNAVKPTIEASEGSPHPQPYVASPETSQGSRASAHRKTHGMTAPDVNAAVTEVESDVGNPPQGFENDPDKGPGTLSRKLWDEAYDSIEIENKDLVKNYLAVLRTFLEKGKAEQITLAEALEISAELNKKAERQDYMAKLVKSGKAKIQRTSKASKVVGDLADGILKLQPVVDIVLNVPQVAPAAIPWAGVCVGLQMLANPKKATQANLDGMSHVVNRMEWYSAIVHHLLEPCSIDSVATSTEQTLLELKPKVVKLYTDILLYQMRSICSYYRNQGFNFLLQLIDFDNWEGARKDVVNAEDDLIKDWKMYDKVKAGKVGEELVKLNLKTKELLGDISQTLTDVLSGRKDQTASDILSNLRVVNPLDDMSRIEDDKEKLIDDTFRWILEEDEFVHFTNWTDTSLPQNRLLWIKGDAGTGKTMLLIGIIRELSNQSAVLSPGLSYFFCQSRGKTRLPLYSLTSALRSLMWILVIQQPKLMSHLETEYHDSKQGLFTGDDAQQTILRIFTNMLKDTDPVCFVIDALDECEEGLKAFIDLVSNSLSISEKVRWLISSRREVKLLDNVKRLTKKNPAVAEVLAELNIQTQKDRTKKYIQQKLIDLELNSEYPETYNAKILIGISREITKRADDNLLWASLVFQDLAKMTGPYALKNIEDYPRGLFKLYDHKMKGLQNGDTHHLECCKDVLVAISLAYRPLSLAELAGFVSWSEKLDPRSILTDCKAFLVLNGEMVTVIHKSARDYLTHQQAELQGGTIQGHAGIAKFSILAMKSGLKQNIYDLEDYGFKPKDMQRPIPDPLELMEYPCVFWAEHLSSIAYKDTSHLEQVMDSVDILQFLEESFLHWLESLSLLGKLADGIRSMRKLQRVIQKHLDSNSALVEWFKDAEKFALSYGWIIEQAPLQTYGAALVFSPKLSKIKNSYWKDRFPFLQDVKGGRGHWANLQQTFDPQSGHGQSVSYSPDNMTLASISAYGELKLWNALTFAHKLTIDCLPKNCLFAHMSEQVIAFSSTVKILASASASTENEVRLWNTETGALDQSFVHGIQAVNVFAVAFSPNGKILATVASDQKIRLWDIDTGVCESSFDFDGSSQVIAFSTNGNILAAAPVRFSEAFIDASIKLWVVDEGTLKDTNPKGTLKGHTKSVKSLTFSPDQHSRMLASGSNDATVRVWRTAECNSKHVLEHPGLVLSVAFYRECQNLISAGYSDMWLWDLDTGSCTAVIGKFSGVTTSIAFTSDATTAAAVDSKIHLWDTLVADQELSVEGRQSRSSTLKVDAIDFSPDGSMLAIVWKDHTYIWDVSENACRSTFDHQPGYVETEAVSFSSNGDTLVLVHLGVRVQLYDTAKGAAKPEKAIFQRRSNSTVVFSPDQSAFAILLEDYFIQLHTFSTNSNTILNPRGDKIYLEGVAFSPDGNKLGALSADKIRIWDTISGDLLETIPHTMDRCGRNSYSSFACSSDMNKFTTSPVGIMQLWDRSADVVRKLNRGESYLSSGIFSVDGAMFAASTPSEIVIWDVADGSVRQTFGFSQKLISFSHDNSLLVTRGGVLKIAKETSGRSEIPPLFMKGQWICEGSKALLWIPDEYRGVHREVHDCKVVLKEDQGGFILISFAIEK